MTGAHDLFKALGLVDWDSFAAQEYREALTPIFDDAEGLINSIPDSSADSGQSPEIAELRKEWKEVKLNASANPFGMHVFKLSSKDGRGAWFARRSVHRGLSFETWKSGMESELAEGLKVQGEPGDGAVRGLGADRRVVNETVDGCGKIEVYELSARFGGPTTPRDFVTLCLSSDSATRSPENAKKARHFILVSKPCQHPECPQKDGFIRGSYESVELIREVKVHEDRKQSQDANSSLDITTTDGNVSSSENAAEGRVSKDDPVTRAGGGSDHEHDVGETVIEWLMITRSDPGGNVPRFLVERGMAPVLASDADKFFKWMSSRNMAEANNDDSKTATEQGTDEEIPSVIPTSITSESKETSSSDLLAGSTSEDRYGEETQGPSGFYGIVAGALSTAASMAASRLPTTFSNAASGEAESDISPQSTSDDTSSIASFHSLEAADATEINSTTESHAAPPLPLTQHEKELKKLEDRRQKTEEKLLRARERALTKRQEDAARDEQALQKLREKHDREMAKQEEKYEREKKRLEAKKTSEEKKAEERRRKQVEREEKADLSLELEKTRTERDLARKEIEILTAQVGRLQASNTELVARMGRREKERDNAKEKSSSDGDDETLVEGLAPKV
ncbi:hypothetical protein F5Y16DRAFT_370511 [Xylariaceae sp. FL0255]|nr:hypothetical protein F5Y16DRAFT_370511 [Xylariaceae sp. FL0255]